MRSGMSEDLPPNPYRCVECLKLWEKPHRACPDCGQAGGVVVRDNLGDVPASISENTSQDDETYRCIDCGNLVAAPYKECPRCGGRGVAPTGHRAPLSQELLDMFPQW